MVKWEDVEGQGLTCGQCEREAVIWIDLGPGPISYKGKRELWLCAEHKDSFFAAVQRVSDGLLQTFSRVSEWAKDVADSMVRAFGTAVDS